MQQIALSEYLNAGKCNMSVRGNLKLNSDHFTDGYGDTQRTKVSLNVEIKNCKCSYVIHSKVSRSIAGGDLWAQNYSALRQESEKISKNLLACRHVLKINVRYFHAGNQVVGKIVNEIGLWPLMVGEVHL